MAVDNISAILPDIFEALDVISREPVGMIGSVTMAASSERASLNQNIVVNIEPEIVGVNATPSMTIPEPAALTPTTASVVISSEKSYPFQITGNAQKGYNTGVGWVNGRVGRIAQALRAATNDVEATLAGLHTQFGAAYGTAGSTPFSSNLSASAQLGKILTDAGASSQERKIVIDTSTGVNIRSLTQLTNVNQSGTSDTLRFGSLLPLNGFDFSESGQIKTSVAGTGTGYLVNFVAGYSVGDKSIALDTGSGTVIAGDVVSYAGDTNKYVVETAISGGVIVLAGTGLRKNLANNVAMTITSASARNMAFNRSAIILAARPVATPEDGDAATDRQMIVDPISGMPFEIAYYKGYKMNRFEINIAHGASVIKKEHTVLLLG